MSGLEPVVAVVCHGHFGADEQQPAVEYEEAAVVSDAPVDDRQADVTYDAIGQVAFQQLGDNFPRMLHRIRLTEVVFAAIARDFQLWADLWHR